MASATISKPPSLSRRASADADASDDDGVTALTPTLKLTRSTSPPPTIRSDLTRLKIATPRDAGQTQARDPWHLNPFCEAGGPRSSVSRPASRNNTGDSTILSNELSVTWDREAEASVTSSDEEYSPVATPSRRFFPVPPPQPSPHRGNPRFPPPPPWLQPAGPVGRWPPARNAQGPVSMNSGSESGSDCSDGATRSLAGEGARPHELQERVQITQRRMQQLRREMSAKRKELQELRRRRDNLDNAFMQIFRPHLTSKSRYAVIPLDVLEEKLGQMQAIRDEYYTAEFVYEAMESELDAEEREFEKLGAVPPQSPPARVNVGPRVQLPPPPPTLKAPGIVKAAEQEDLEDGENASSAPSSPITLRGISGDLHEDIDPLYEELLEAAGDHKLAKEHSEDIAMHREKILHDLEIAMHRKRVREDQGNQISEEDLLSLRTSLTKVPTDAIEFQARFGIEITEDELDFLRNYEAVSRLAQEELDATTGNLADLRALCLKKGVMRKHASYNEELAIFSSCPDWKPHPQDGTISLEPPLKSQPPGSGSGNAAPIPTLAHPRFPILLSNPSHVLSLLTPLQALERALRLPKDDPSSALRRAECMKELGISMLMSKAENTADYINQWLIHRLRTCPLEAELMLAVCEGVFRVVNLRRWQEEVLYYWRLDEAAAARAGEGDVGDGHGKGLGRVRVSPVVEGYFAGGSVGGGEGNSVIEGEGRVRSEVGEGRGPGSPVVGRDGRARSVRSLG